MKKPRRRKLKKKKRSVGHPPPKRAKKAFLWLNVLPDDLWVKVRRGKTIWEAVQDKDVTLEGECDGRGKCGKCKVSVISPIGRPSEEERALLDEEELKQGIRLACRIRVKKDLVIYVGDPDSEVEYFQILKAGERPILQLDPLVDKRLVTLPTNEGLSYLGRIKAVLGPEYQDLKASLYCLRTLPDALKRTGFRGTAVLQDNCLMAWQSAREVGRRYGLVFDLGTSTLVCKLISLLEGNEVAVVSCLNGQSRFGTNVISRLQYIKENRGGLELLHNILVRDLNRISARVLNSGGLEPKDIFVAVVAGNTTMQHLLVGLDPLGIAQAPFSPVLTDGLVLKAADVGLKLHPEASLYVMPTKSGYIGGDLISVIMASGAADRQDEVSLGLDLGTNGEIFLGNGKRMLTCSAASGPALEGANISHGMIARSGAIEGFRIEEEDLRYRIIGNVNPKGICGSGLVDLVAVLLHWGIINHEGLICPPPEGIEDALGSRTIKRSEAYDFLIASEEESYNQRPIYLTQRDVRELQLAKGAIAGGIRILLDEMGVEVRDIARVYLAGALGNYVNLYSAMRIGLIPMVEPERVYPLGNAASTGPSMVLLSKTCWERANRLTDFIEHVELSSRSDFNQYFVEEMDFPTENTW